MAAYTKKSREEIKKEMSEYSQKITDIGENFKTDPNLISEYLAFASKFYNFSVKNQKLIFAQNPYAQFVGNFQSFKNKGYSVEKGQKGLKVFVPVEATYFYRGKEKTKLIDATKAEKIQIKAKTIKTHTELHFKLGSVFDVSQTNCPVNEYPKIFHFGEASKDHQKVYERLKEHFMNKGMKIDEGGINSLHLKGYYVPGKDKIQINQKLQDTERLATFVHEIAHKLLDHDGYKEESDVSQKEFEADALSVMISSRLDIEITDGTKDHLSSNYKKFVGYRNELNEADQGKYSVDNSFTKINKVFKKEIEGIEKALSEQIEKSDEKRDSHTIIDQENDYEMEL